MDASTTTVADPPAGGVAAPRRRRADPWSTGAALAVLAVVVGLAIAAGAWHASGGRWFVVETASMGRAAPVGTLVVTRPTTVATTAPGDVVSFRPALEPGAVYTHRVTAVGADGLRTSGDSTGAVDPWAVTDADLLGRAVVLAPGLGWLLRAVPALALGGLALWGLGTRVRDRARRASLRLLGATVLVTATVAALRPLVGAEVLSTTMVDGTPTSVVVGTGLAPVRVAVQAPDGDVVDLVSGAVGTLALPPSGARTELVTSLHLDGPGTVLLALVCALPLLWVLVVGLPGRAPQEAR
ncbi:S26 family signal peptidase [Frigoribacterium salinisoli]